MSGRAVEVGQPGPHTLAVVCYPITWTMTEGANERDWWDLMEETIVAQDCELLTLRGLQFHSSQGRVVELWIEGELSNCEIVVGLAFLFLSSKF